MKLDGKTVVITGASKGLGLGLAEYFGEQGAQLGLCARSAIPLKDSAKLYTAKVDVSICKQVRQFGEDVVKRFGHIDLWINNAGVLGPVKSARDLDPESLGQAWEVNFMGTFYGCQFYTRHVRTHQHSGVLINMSSGAARAGVPGWSAYCASKAAVERLAECISLEEADAGLRCHSLSPGIIDTQMQEAIRGSAPEDFPMVEKFHEYKDKKAFHSTEHVAKEIDKISFSGSDDRQNQVIIKL